MLSDQIVFCVSPEHPLASYKEATMEMLKDEPLIMYNTDSVLNTTLQARFDSLQIKPKVLLSASQLYTIHNFVKNHLGGAFLYSSLMENMPGCIGIPVTPSDPSGNRADLEEGQIYQQQRGKIHHVHQTLRRDKMEELWSISD